MTVVSFFQTEVCCGQKRQEIAVQENVHVTNGVYVSPPCSRRRRRADPLWPAAAAASAERRRQRRPRGGAHVWLEPCSNLCVALHICAQMCNFTGLLAFRQSQLSKPPKFPWVSIFPHSCTLLVALSACSTVRRRIFCIYTQKVSFIVLFLYDVLTFSW